MSIRARSWVSLFAVVAVIGFGASTAFFATADEEGESVDELFKSSREAYGDKKYGKALADLNALVAAISKLRVEQLKGKLPAPPEGWEADEATAETLAQLAGGGITVERTYRKGDSSVEIEMVSDSPLVGAMAPMFMNPMIIQSNPAMSTLKIQGRQAVIEFEKGANHGKLYFLLNGNTTLLTLGGQEVDRKALTETFGKALDLDGLEKALQN